MHKVFPLTSLPVPLNVGEHDQSFESGSHDGGGGTSEPPRTPNNKPDCLRYMHSINSVLSKKVGYLNAVATDSPVVNYPVNIMEAVCDSCLKQFIIIKATFLLFEHTLNKPQDTKVCDQ